MVCATADGVSVVHGRPYILFAPACTGVSRTECAWGPMSIEYGKLVDVLGMLSKYLNADHGVLLAVV